MAAYEGDISNTISEIKRCYVDGVVITKKCPECGEDIVYDMSDHYLSYPSNEDVLWFYCSDGCEHEWKVPIKISAKIVIEEV